MRNDISHEQALVNSDRAYDDLDTYFLFEGESTEPTAAEAFCYRVLRALGVCTRSWRADWYSDWPALNTLAEACDALATRLKGGAA